MSDVPLSEDHVLIRAGLRDQLYSIHSAWSDDLIEAVVLAVEPEVARMLTEMLERVGDGSDKPTSNVPMGDRERAEAALRSSLPREASDQLVRKAATAVLTALDPARRDALAPIRALLDTPAIRAADGNGAESFVAVSDLRAALETTEESR